MQRFRQILHATKCDKLSVASWERAPSTKGGGMIRSIDWPADWAARLSGTPWTGGNDRRVRHLQGAQEKSPIVLRWDRADFGRMLLAQRASSPMYMAAISPYLCCGRAS